ncbi:F-box protein At5g50450-like [Cynara cardunculus var. scolymus]|nr:F-box protein At5g50450-like [Cynara cardunculus var. scolymus]
MMMMMMKKKLRGGGGAVYHGRTRSDLFDSLPDDIVISVLCKLSSTASSPSDFVAVLLTCKRLNKLGVHPLVLSKSSSKALAVRATNWCDGAHRFLKLCVNAGNTEAYYILGMIRFYCLQNRGSGASLMAKAAIKSHAPALYSLALIQFNGSGGFKNDKDLRAGVALCARAAFLGHIDALRELGHCLQDGYGVRKNITEGRRLLVQANARELASVLRVFHNNTSSPPSSAWIFRNHQPQPIIPTNSNTAPNPTDFDFQLFSDYGFNLTGREMHPANRFLVEWFGSIDDGSPGQGLRMCSYKGCGRPETRRNEFRRCSGCGKVNYCSRGCQAHDWRVHHKVECAPMEEWVGHAIDDVEEEDIMNGDDVAIDDQTVEIEDGDVDGIQI